jgi:hypothetical protein
MDFRGYKTMRQGRGGEGAESATAALAGYDGCVGSVIFVNINSKHTRCHTAMVSEGWWLCSTVNRVSQISIFMRAAILRFCASGGTDKLEAGAAVSPHSKIKGDFFRLIFG